MKLTPWFLSPVRPAYKGVYVALFGYAFWNGRYWSPVHGTPEGARALGMRKVISLNQAKDWRGLKEKASPRGRGPKPHP